MEQFCIYTFPNNTKTPEKARKGEKLLKVQTFCLLKSIYQHKLHTIHITQALWITRPLCILTETLVMNGPVTIVVRKENTTNRK